MKKLLLLLAFMAFLPLAANSATLAGIVEHGTDSVIINVDLYDITDPTICPSTDVTHSTQDLNITIYDDVTNGVNDFFECTGAACVTTDTIGDITTLGTYGTPGANSANFKVMEAGSCTYQVHLPNAVFDTVGANVINMQISAPGIITSNTWVDLTPISSATLINNLLDTSCTSFATPDDVGYQLCTINNAILLDTGTTLENRQASIASQVAIPILVDAAADSGTTTTIVDADGLFQADDFFNNWASVVVEGYPARCIVDQVNSTNTITFSPALDTAVDTDSYSILADPSCAGIPATLATGTADSGTTASFVDAALTQADTDYWAKNVAVVFTSGNISGQTFCVSGFTPGSDTITFSPVATQAVATQDYMLIAAPGCDPFR